MPGRATVSYFSSPEYVGSRLFNNSGEIEHLHNIVSAGV